MEGMNNDFELLSENLFDSEEQSQNLEDTSASSSLSTLDKIVEGITIGDGLAEDILIELIKETDIQHRSDGIDGSYAGNVKSEDKINALLEDIDVPLDIKTETISHDNILNVSNYSEFLMLQSRLTGVPFSTLVNGLKIFEDETIGEARTEEEATYDFDEDIATPTEQAEDIELELESDIEELDLEEIEEEEEEEFDLEDEEDIEVINEEVLIHEEAFDLEDEDMLDDEDKEDLDIPEIEVTDMDTSTDIDIQDSLESLNIEEDYTEDFMEDLSDEPFEVAPASAAIFNNSKKNKVNSSKTYALHTLDVGGNYNV